MEERFLTRLITWRSLVQIQLPQPNAGVAQSVVHLICNQGVTREAELVPEEDAPREAELVPEEETPAE